jgi:hypothetical protein
MCFARTTNVPTAVSGGATVNLPPLGHLECGDIRDCRRFGRGG